MGLVNIHDEVLQGVKNIAYKKRVPVENLIETVIQDYVQCLENEKINRPSLKSRKYRRRKTDWDDNLHFQFDDAFSNEKFPGKLKDISLDGLAFSFADQYCAQEDLSFCSQTLIVSFESPENKRTIRFRMAPRHIRKEGNENIVGLAFTDDDCDYHDLVTFLQLVEQQERIGNSPSPPL